MLRARALKGIRAGALGSSIFNPENKEGNDVGIGGSLLLAMRQCIGEGEPLQR